jgi:hypothetical protein
MPYLNIPRWSEILTAGSSEAKAMFRNAKDDLGK